MSDKEKFDASLTTPRHWIAVAVIIACGMVGGALILRPRWRARSRPCFSP